MEIFSKEFLSKIICKNEKYKSLNIDFVYSVFKKSYDLIFSFTNSIDEIETKDINQILLLSLISGEYDYYFSSIPKEKLDETLNKDSTVDEMSAVIADKYFTLDNFSNNYPCLISRFSPVITTLDLCLNVMNNMLTFYKEKDKENKLIYDLIYKSVSLIKSILLLIIRGHDTEAMAIWRTLHECESILLILNKNGKKTTKSYYDHMQYSIAFRGGIFSKEQTDDIFIKIKEEMASHNLKSKDMKKFIEYGWLYSVSNFKEEDGYKLNFRDGLEKVAGLSSYSKIYEMSSEIIHATPSLIYSNAIYYHFLCILTTYESFFRIEKMFSSYLIPLLDKSLQEKYEITRKTYIPQLMSIYSRERSTFTSLKRRKK